MKKSPFQILSDNRSARYHYEILAEFEAGIMLNGKEVKSLKTNSAKLSGSFIKVRGNGIFLVGFKIPPYKYAKNQPYEAARSRKLLLNLREIERIQKSLNEKGTTCIPLDLHFSHGRIKVKIALARGKKRWDKRETIKKRDLDREALRELKQL